MEVEPPQQDLIRRQPQELLQRLSVVQQPVELGVVLDVDLAEETSSNDLPDESEDEMFGSVGDIGRTDVDDRASDTIGRGDDDVVVLCDLEGVESFGLSLEDGGFVENSLVDGVGNGVVDELGENETVCWEKGRKR